MQKTTKTVMNATMWLSAFMWAGYVAYSTWIAIEKIFSSGETPLQIVTALIAALILTLPTLVVVLQVTRWIARDSTVERP
ncbi:hypothetical protein [Massilia varians]|uniref:hypothetical protein n=1 Tax=Massilia varians TaxID=457921 RepID=UPI002555E686|nr:hypothetical protein [Massilia varians]MDK6080366.1 hypothetical protein [Massilia varians]